MSASTSPLILGTPLEDHTERYGLLVKREDLSCPPPGPPFSKTRGVFAHVGAKVEAGVTTFGVLDTYHSQAGHAVALACRHYGVECLNFFPAFKREEVDAPGFDRVLKANGVWTPIREPQRRAALLEAALIPLPAGRSAILFHQAKRMTEAAGGYMMPNALKLPETVEETAKEVMRTFLQASPQEVIRLRQRPWIVASSSGTIAAGVIKGLLQCGEVRHPRVIIHMGYDRSQDAVKEYLGKASGYANDDIEDVVEIVNEGYAYADTARKAGDWAPPPWPCNPYYDLKAFRWWVTKGRKSYGTAVLWNIG